MRFLSFLALFCTFMAISPYAAQANSFWQFFTPPVPDYETMLLENGKQPNHVYWDQDKWVPADWIRSRGSAEEVIDDLYAAQIITDQYDEDGQPVLEVGQGFMRLSNTDKRRVASFVDYAYGITASAEDGMFFVYHWRTGDSIGLYNKYGLQIQ